MKFLHTGDLHLDSAFCRHGAMGADRLRQRSRDVLRRIFDLAAAEDCDMILIAGDLFDSRTVTPETERLVLSLCSSFGRPVLVSPGNHDPYEAGSFWCRRDLPSNLYVFNSRELQRFEFPNLKTAVYGYAFLSASFTERPLLGAEAPAEDGGEIRLLCAHGDLCDPLSKYAPITQGDIDKLGFAYAALGHVHNRMGSEGAAQYCGMPEGRSFDEPGEGGVMLVEIRDGAAHAERRIVSEIEFCVEELDVGGVESAEELEARLAEFAEGFGRERAARTCLRLSLCGMIADELIGELSARGTAIAERFAQFEWRNDTVPAANGDYLARDSSIRGAFYRVLEPMLKSDDPDERARAVRALRIGLCAIDGKRFTDQDAERN